MLADVPNILDDLTETSVIIENAEWSDIEKAVAFFENQIFSFSSTGKTFAIAKKDMTKRFGRLVAACSRLRNAVIMHRDYKDCISYAAGKDTFILLDPPYKGTENYYQKANFGADEHAMLFEFMNGIHEKYKGECKFIITYNNDPYIRELADKYGFDTFVKERLHNMLQSTKPGEMFEELLIGNYDLLKQADPSIYDEVFDAEIDETDLESIYARFNTDRHPLFRGHSLSVSDVVVMDGKSSICQNVGFREVPFDVSQTQKPDNLMRVVYVEPNKPPYVAEIENTLEGKQRAVQGYIEPVYIENDGTCLIGNEEAKLIGMEGNRRIGPSSSSFLIWL